MYDRLKSAYLKKVRTEKGLKLSAVASLTHYSTAYISELERGKKTISTSEWSSLFSSLDISIIDDSSISNTLSLFQEIYDCIYYIKSERKNSFEKKLYENANFYLNSVIFLHYHLLMFIFLLDKHDIESAKTHYKICNKYSEYFSPDEKYSYDVYKSLFLLKNNSINEAFSLMKSLIKQHVYIQPITSMMHYYFAHLYLIKNDYLNGYHHLCIAKDSYLSIHNIKRYCIALQLEANIYSEQQLFSQANIIYNQLLESLDNSTDVIYNGTCLNYSYNLMRQLDYNRALDVLDKCSINFTTIPLYLFNKAWSLYHLDKNECKKYISSIDFDAIDDKYIECCLKIIDLLIDDECSSTIESLINNALQELHLDLESSAKEFLLTQLLEYYRRTDNIKKQNKTLEALVALYKGEPHENL